MDSMLFLFDYSHHETWVADFIKCFGRFFITLLRLLPDFLRTAFGDPWFCLNWPPIIFALQQKILDFVCTMAADPRFCLNYWCGSSLLTSDLSLKKSLAISSVVLCDKIRNIVQPVSSICILRPRESQQAHEPWSRMSFNCITETPIRRSSRPKQ